MITLNSSVGNLSRVGERNRKHLETLGIETCQDLIFYFPFRFDDFSAALPIAELKQNAVATICGRIEMIGNRRSQTRKKIITEAIVRDATGQVKVIWFNQPFLAKNFIVGDRLYLSGQTNENYYDLTLVSPVYEKVVDGKEQLHTGRLVPVYALTRGLFEKQFRLLVNEALAQCLSLVVEWLPDNLLREEGLMSIHDALHNIHFPKNAADAMAARKRLSFDEIFFLQVFGRTVRREFSAQLAPGISFHENETKDWMKTLPFTLTSLQKKIAWDILGDIALTRPMNRLLEGDVGAGKTVIAAAALYNAIRSGIQSAVMAPTEILARQHFDTLSRYFENADARIGLFTSKQCRVNCRASDVDVEMRNDDISREEILGMLARGDMDIVVGTHALIEPDIGFRNLGLVVVDEQHRFGVRQRQLLREKRTDGGLPHLLSLTATPIPRTLALTLYGDLDISILDELPAGRKKITTKIVPAQYREWTYEFIKKHIRAGRQAFIICPRVDVSDATGMKSVKEEFARLSKGIFSDIRVGMIHGKMKQKDKESAMDQMLAGTIDVLIASSVIEVGIDIPNATIILIEGAERFGLAQLHQFRGRVGRAHHQSFCFLLPTDSSKEETARLQAVIGSTNGFELAQKDLELRGPGELYGRTQSGLPALKIADLMDAPLVESAKKWAEIIEPALQEHPKIIMQLENFRKDVHLE